MKKNNLSWFIIALFVGIGILAMKRPNIETVREAIEKGLKKKWGEEFVVDMIGTRSANGKSFYTSRIKLKKYIGTNKENDKYYIGQANAEAKLFGRAEYDGSDYGQILISMQAEEFLMPKIKEIFGERVTVIPEVDFKERRGNDTAFYTWFIGNLKKAIKLAKNQPDRYKLEMKLYIYVYDRIDDEKEKERRRGEVFRFAKYLHKESLYNFTYLKVLFRDEKVLIPSFSEYNISKNISKQEFIKIDKLLEKKIKKISINKVSKILNSYSKTELRNNKILNFYCGFSRVDTLYNEGSKNIRNINNLLLKDIEFELYKENLYNKYILNIK